MDTQPENPDQNITSANEVANDLRITPYDNDITLLYKWAFIFGVPIQLVIVRPRLPDEPGNGTANYIFESLPDLVSRLYREGESTLVIYDTVKNAKPSIDIEDVAMVLSNTLQSDKERYRTINLLYREVDNNTIDKFEGPDDLDRYYASWYNNNIDKQRRTDILRLNSIIDIQNKLTEVEQQDKIPISPISMISGIMSFNPTLNGELVIAEDGLDIFNKAITSKYVPYIRYNDKYGKAFSRVYTGGEIDSHPNYSSTILTGSGVAEPNTIYMTLWLGDEELIELHNSTKDAFSKVIYRLDNNYLTIESPVGTDIKKKKKIIGDEKIAHQRVRDALPTLDFGEGKEIKVRGEFNMWGIPFNETSFLDMVLIEPLMNVYLYIEENMEPFALKKRLDVHYRSIFTDERTTTQAYIANSASVSITIVPRTTTAEEVVETFDPITSEIKKVVLTAGTSYVHINISQAESRDIVKEFVNIFMLLMRYYIDYQTPIMNMYNMYLPGVSDELQMLLTNKKRKSPTTTDTGILKLIRKKTLSNRPESKIKYLQERAPELFVVNYARRCQCPLQPIIIDDDEIDTWKQQLVDGKERQIMKFPPHNPRWNLVCPDNANPYPGVKVNHDLPNRTEFPYIPCCRKTDQMSPGVNSHYRDYVEGKPIDKRIGAKTEGKISTRKIRAPDKVAFLPKAVGDILKRYSSRYVDMVRYGILYTPNSLIHCALNAVDDPFYAILDTETQKEDYAVKVRKHITTTIIPSLLKQELYDYSDDEIISMLSNVQRFLDPSLFYRAIEETFGINIYTFLAPPPISNETEFGEIDVPRFKIFHARPLRLDRPTMVIIKMRGSESNALEYPQCELIVDHDKDNMQIMKLFGPEMTEICHGALQDTIKTMTWAVLPNNNFEVHSNIYYYIDHLSLFKLQPISQFIDDNGKMRALTFSVGNDAMTIATIPSQPENLPVTNQVQRISGEVVIRMLGEPTGITRDIKGDVNGLWFRIMDIKYGEYIPIIPSSNYQNIDLGPPNPIETIGLSITGRLSKLRKTLNIIVQLVKWLYELARSKEQIDPNDFAMKYMIRDEGPVQDSANYYDLTNIPRRLPPVDDIETAIKLLSNKSPTLFHQGKIIMYDLVFAERMVKMLRDYNNLYPALQPMTPKLQAYISKLCITNNVQSIVELRGIATALKIDKPHTLTKANLCSSIRSRYKDAIDNYYETEEDFDQIPNSKIFINEVELKAWMSSLKSSQNYSRYFNIKSKLDVTVGLSDETYYADQDNGRIGPYIYQDSDGKIYLIQHVVGATRERAISVANIWHTHKINVGSDPVLIFSPPPVHMIYGISPSSKMIPIEDSTNGSDIFLKILYYGTQLDKAMGKGGRYAAVLEIL